MVFLFRPKNYKYIELFLETRDSKPLLDHSLLIIAGTRLEVNREPLKGRPQVENFSLPLLLQLSGASKQVGELPTLGLPFRGAFYKLNKLVTETFPTFPADS